MLADDIGRRAHLKIVLHVNARDEVGVMERNAVVGVRAEEERFRRFRSGLGWTNVGPERQNARLRVVPAGLIQFQVKLKRSRFVEAWRPNGLSKIVNAGIGKRSAGFAWQAIENEIGWRSIRLEARMQTLFVVDHLGYFSSSSGLANCHCLSCTQRLIKIETRLHKAEQRKMFFVVCNSAAHDDVT